MGLPLILYDIAPLLNPSFETGTTGNPPTSWTEDTATTDKSDGLAFSPGSGAAATASMYFVTSGGSPSCHQDVTWAPGNNLTIGICGMVRKSAAGTGNLQIQAIQMTGGSPGTAIITANADATSVHTAWTAIVGTGVQDTTAVNAYRFQMSAGSGNAVNPHIDYLHMGQALDFTEQPFNAIEVSNSFRSNLAVGAGAYEAVELGDPMAHITATIARVTKDSALETSLLAFLGYTRGHRRFAFWLDRTVHTNVGKHFSNCILDDVVVLGERAGANGRTFQLNFTAPLEWMPQELS